eukprot:6638858-Ditylum_brightwellii.AAC.1
MSNVGMTIARMKKKVIALCEHATTSGSTGVDLVNVENDNKFTKHQVHYTKKLAKQVKDLSGEENVSDKDSLIRKSVIEGASGRLICQEVTDKDDQAVDDQ